MGKHGCCRVYWINECEGWGGRSEREVPYCGHITARADKQPRTSRDETFFVSFLFSLLLLIPPASTDPLRLVVRHCETLRLVTDHSGPAPRGAIIGG